MSIELPPENDEACPYRPICSKQTFIITVAKFDIPPNCPVHERNLQRPLRVETQRSIALNKCRFQHFDCRKLPFRFRLV
jgi:hypothetical protein